MAELGKDQAWLRSSLEIEANVITNWKSRGAPASKAVSIALALGLTTDQLLGSPADPVDIPGAMRVVIAEQGDPNFYHIKKVKLQLRAGVTGFQTVPDIYDGDTISLRKNWVDRKGIHPSTLLALTVAGESMEPNLYEGDVVIIDTADKAMKDGVVYAFNYDGEAVIKRLVKERGDWWLFSDNPDQARHRPKGCRTGDCEIIGRVVKRETDHI
ncbi:S24 family peptidase [Duganella callida]|uniref:S24 family peptidase n=1 Tax=Duganella callida TaxID=2561932 RepID=UPI00142FDDFF|nr:S24 family peptidase [Duganella callida]